MLAEFVMQGDEAEEELSWLYRTFYTTGEIAQDLEDKGANICAKDYALKQVEPQTCSSGD